MKNFWVKKANAKRGFTLVELIVVIAILVILAAILIPVVGGYIEQAQDATGNANARTVYSAACAWIASELADGDAITTAPTGTDLAPFLGQTFRGLDDVVVTLNGTEVATALWADPTSGITYTYTAATGEFLNSRP